MSRNISFALTTPQFKARTKTVTRRLGWCDLKIGEVLGAVEKCQGIPKGGKVTKLGKIRVKDVRRERVDRLTVDEAYGRAEVVAEGFPEMSPAEFVAFFCKANRPCLPSWTVTRIEYEYVDDPA
jgi:hypothetical protein